MMDWIRTTEEVPPFWEPVVGHWIERDTDDHEYQVCYRIDDHWSGSVETEWTNQDDDPIWHPPSEWAYLRSSAIRSLIHGSS